MYNSKWWCPPISAKFRAILDLVRADLVFGAGIFVVAGEILGLGALPSLQAALLGFLTGLFTSGSANISNDYFDREVDRINQPGRPLPSGRVSVAEIWTLSLIFAAVGLAAATLLGPRVLTLAAAAWAVALLYNVKLKEMGLLGNLSVAFCVSMTVILGGTIVGAINGIVLTFAALAFLFDLGEEIASDAMDVKGRRAAILKEHCQKKGPSLCPAARGRDIHRLHPAYFSSFSHGLVGICLPAINCANRSLPFLFHMPASF